MAKRTLAAAAAILLLAGCTTGTVFTVGPVKSMDLPTPSAPATVHITLHVEADQPAIIRYSDGVTTKSAEMALEGNGDAGTMDIEFDAPQPYFATATVVTDKPGKLTCNMGATGLLVGADPDPDDPDPVETGSLGGTGGTVNHGTFNMCRASVDYDTPGTPAATDHVVELRTKASGDNDWYGWAGAYSSGEDLAAGSATTEVSQPAGSIRLIVIATEPGDEVSCRIVVDNDRASGESTDDYGDIATCAVTVE